MWLSVAERRTPAPEHVELLMEAPDLARSLRPGQFAHVRTDGILRRPLSFSRVDGQRVGLLFRIVGQGTAWLADRRPGDDVEVLAPLGRGFPDPPPGPLCLVGGGVGVPPLHLGAQRWADRPDARVIIGARRADDLLMAEEFAALGFGVDLTTDDGSRGEPGRVTAPLERWLARHPDGAVMACGPTAMLAAVAAMVEPSRPSWFAFEQRMGCGVGACLACVVPGWAAGSPRWVRVCTEGPVFARDELNWAALSGR